MLLDLTSLLTTPTFQGLSQFSSAAPEGALWTAPITTNPPVVLPQIYYIELDTNTSVIQNYVKEPWTLQAPNSSTATSKLLAFNNQTPTLVPNLSQDKTVVSNIAGYIMESYANPTYYNLTTSNTMYSNLVSTTNFNPGDFELIQSDVGNGVYKTVLYVLFLVSAFDTQYSPPPYCPSGSSTPLPWAPTPPPAPISSLCLVETNPYSTLIVSGFQVSGLYAVVQSSTQFNTRCCANINITIDQAAQAGNADFCPSAYLDYGSSCDEFMGSYCVASATLADPVCGCYPDYIQQVVVDKDPTLKSALGGKKLPSDCVTSCNVSSAYMGKNVVEECDITICEVDITNTGTINAKYIDVSQDCGQPTPTPSPKPPTPISPILIYTGIGVAVLAGIIILLIIVGVVV